MPLTDTSPYLAALRGRAPSRRPIWIMRQAGRFLPEYRRVRETTSFIGLCKTPELACDVTLMPVRRFGFDAAILFSDILTPLEPMGAPFAFTDRGPRVDRPLRNESDVTALRVVDPREELGFVAEAIRLIKAELPTGVPLIGFAGAPLTLASYLIEGGGSRDFRHLKTMLYSRPDLLDALLAKLADQIARHLRMQVEAGADAVQVFDTWGGILHPGDYRRHVLPGLRRIFAALADLEVPRVLFLKGGAPYLELCAASGADAVGLDWTIDVRTATARLPGLPVQGNLDPLFRQPRGDPPPHPGRLPRRRRGSRPRVQPGPRHPARHTAGRGGAAGGDGPRVPAGGAVVTREVPRSLVERFDRPGPRYTSYPTVPSWSRDFGETDYREALRALAARPDDELSIYLHLPFCARHCHYCGCNAVVSRERDAVDRYLDAVERELEMVTAEIGTGRRAVQLHWGGGTPNYLKDRQVERALGMLRHAFAIDPGAEISLEVDPRIGTPEQARFLRGQGFNRISLGVQDFSPRVQKAIGRLQKRERTERLFRACREAGFHGVNLDLVYGLPYQTPASFAETLTAIIALRPDRVACFSYAHVPWVRPLQRRVDTTEMPAGYRKFTLFLQAIAMFEEAGYDWIGIDHFARRDDELSVALRERRLHRNFMGYTTRPAPHMLAFGMSGIGEVADRFVQNDAGLEGYRGAIAAGRLPVVRGLALSDDDRLRRLVILNLMCNLELPFDLTVPSFGAPADELLAADLPRLQPYADEGLVELLPDRVRITGLGRFFARNVCMELDPYLEHQTGRPLFSRTV